MSEVPLYHNNIYISLFAIHLYKAWDIGEICLSSHATRRVRKSCIYWSLSGVQRYLAHKKQRLPRSRQ
jgi:hypothetical protein